MTDDKAQLIATLARVPLFAGLDDAQRRRLALRAVVRRLPAGAELFAAGDRALGFFIVLSGSVKVYRLSPEGREHILHFCQPPDPIAESAVFADAVYPASARAIDDALLGFIPRAELLDALRREPDLAMAMLAGMSRRLREFVNTIEDLSLRDVSARLAGWLLANARDGACRLPSSKAELAAHIGTVAEPLSRALRKLKAAGLIEETGARIRLLDEPALRRLREGGE